jgi:hypothetical protein
MYEQAEEELKKILALVELCPEPLRGDAFKILLEGYVRASMPSPPAKSPQPDGTKTPTKPAEHLGGAIPPDVQTRLGAMAKRRNLSAEQLAGLFDFTTDPFTFAPLNLTGENNTDRTKNVALLVAARSFLPTGKWVGDWAEIKAMTSHQNCHDVANFAAGLKKLKSKQFKGVTVGTSVELSATGTDEAEQLLAKLAAK